MTKRDTIKTYDMNSAADLPASRLRSRSQPLLSLKGRFMKTKFLIRTATVLTLLLGYAGAVHGLGAQPKAPSSGDLMPAVTTQSQDSAQTNQTGFEGETHPILNLGPDRSELVPLSRDAHSVIVGNPEHITVLLDSPRLAVIVPKQAGATYFTVLDKSGNVVMQRHVVVAAPKKNYVRIRRSCGNVADGQDCKPTSVYFCPDMCHEIDAAAATRTNP